MGSGLLSAVRVRLVTESKITGGANYKQGRNSM